MDFNKIIARAKAILLNPKTEWPIIAAEPATSQSLLMGYVLPLAALAAIAMFIKSSLIGYGGFGFNFRTGIGTGLASAVISVGVSVLWIFLMALIIDALAPSFGATKDRTQAMKTATYAATASWLASVFYILSMPLGAFLSLIGMLYGGYLMIVGLPHTMKAPPEKATGYGIVSILCAIVLSWVLAAIVGALGFSMGGGMGRSSLYGSGLGSSTISSDDGSVTVNGGALSGLAAFAAKAEKAGKEMEAAEKSGNADAQAAAAGNLMATVLGGGDKVESLATDRIKGFLPATLAGLKQQSSSAERNAAMGMQVSEAKATYGDDNGKSLRLEITDMGSAKGLMGLASWVNVEQDKQTSTGYEKVYKQGDNMIHERWDSSSKDGEFGAVVAGRFMVKVEGQAGSMDELKSALGSVDLAGLAALKNEGVKTASN